MEDLPVIVRDIAVLICDEPSILEEAMSRVSLRDIPYQRIGTRALLTQSVHASALVEAFHSVGIFPRVVGHYLSDEEA